MLVLQRLSAITKAACLDLPSVLFFFLLRLRNFLARANGLVSEMDVRTSKVAKTSQIVFDAAEKTNLHCRLDLLLPRTGMYVNEISDIL